MKAKFLDLCSKNSRNVPRRVVPILRDVFQALKADDLTKAREIASAHPDAELLLKEACNA